MTSEAHTSPAPEPVKPGLAHIVAASSAGEHDAHPDRTAAMLATVTRTGFYPGVMAWEISRMLNGATVRGFAVLQSYSMEDEGGMRVETRLMALTDSRLLYWAGFEEPGADGKKATLHSVARTIPLSRVQDVRVVSEIANPADFEPGDLPSAVKVAVVLDLTDQFTLRTVTVANAEGEEGQLQLGDVIYDVLVLSETLAGVGPEKIRELLELASQLEAAFGAADQ